MNELQQLAAFASGLAWEDIPAPVKSACKSQHFRYPFRCIGWCFLSDVPAHQRGLS